MAETVYALCALTSLVCAVLLHRARRRGGQAFLLGCATCFYGLAATNVLLFVDVVLVPHLDLSLWRVGTALAAMLALLTGLVWGSR